TSFSTTTQATTTSEITTSVITSHSTPPLCVKEECHWSRWYDVYYPGSGYNDGDFETVQNIIKKGYKVCENRKAVECRAVRFPDTPYQLLEQHVTCNTEEGLICYNKDQLPPICYNYEVRFKCCVNITVPCTTMTPTTTTQKTQTSPLTSTTSSTSSTEVTHTPHIHTKYETTTISTTPPKTDHIHSRSTTQPT
ncbi:MUC5A protein, partial [Eurystomus gularis]|nr:MUC5A protein [Eurystomus gularis]